MSYLQGVDRTEAAPPVAAHARSNSRRVDGVRVDRWIVLAATVLTFALCAASIFTREGLYLDGDEFGLFAIAAHFTGHDWSVVTQDVGYYSFLYPILWIVPAFAILGDIEAVYASTLWINAALAATIPSLAYVIAKRWGFELIGNPWLRGLILVGVTLGGPLVAYASLGLAEVQLAVLYLICLLMLVRLRERPSLVNSIGLAVASIAVYFSHQRSIGVLLALLVCVGLLWIVRRIGARHLLAFLSVGAVLYIAGDWLKRYVIRVVWLDSPTAQGNDVGGRLDRLSDLLDLSTWTTLIQVAVGQVWSLTAASFLLAPVAVALMVVLMARGIRRQKVEGELRGIRALAHGLIGQDASPLFLLLATLFTVGVSILAMAKAVRLDHYVYERYTWFVLPALMLWLFIKLATEEVPKLRWWQILPGWLLLTAGATWVLAHHASRFFMHFNVVSLSPYIAENGIASTRAIGAACASAVALLGLVIMCVRSSTARGTIWALALTAMAVTGVVSSATTVGSVNRFVTSVNDPVNALARTLDDTREVYFHRVGRALPRWQFNLPDQTLRPLEDGAAGAGAYVLTSEEGFFDATDTATGGKPVGTAQGVVVIEAMPGEPPACVSGLDLLPRSHSQTDNGALPGLQNEGREGYIAFGQYTDLPQGDYVATVRLRGPVNSGSGSSAAEAASRVAVASQHGRAIAQTEIAGSGDEMEDGAMSIDVPFTATEALTDAEVQVWVAEGVAVDIEDISLSCVPPGDRTWTFRAGGTGVGGLGEGWSLPEAWGTWSDATEASLHLDLPEDWSGDARLTVALEAFAPAGRGPQRVEARSGGEALGEWEVGAQTSLDIHVPASAILAGGIDMVFSLPDAISPETAGVSADDRTLGIGLRAITLRAS